MKRNTKGTMPENAEKLSFHTTTRFLWSYMSGMKGKYILFYFGWLFHTIVGVVTPIVFGAMIDRVIYDNDLAGFLKIGTGFFGITVLGIVLYYIIYEMYAVVWNGIHRRLRMVMFDKLQRLSAEEMVSLQHGDTGNMIQFWAGEGVHFMIRNVVHNANNVFRILLCLVILFLINPVFGLVSVVMVPVSVISTFYIGKRIRSNSEKNKEKYAKYISWLYEVAESFGEIRVWSAKEYSLKKYDKKLNEMNRLNAKIEIDNCVGNELLANIKNVILIVQYGLLAYYAITGDLQMGTITVMLAYFTTLSGSLSELAKNYMDAQNRISVIERIYRFLRKQSVNSESGTERLKEEIREITFQNCRFRYRDSETDVLQGICFSIKQGEKVAVVGSSGAGKSTLLNLLLGLYQPQEGEILVNGKDIAQFDKDFLYQRFSVVFQHVLLFQGTIRENLQMGEEVQEEGLEKACRAADILDYVTEQKDRFDTILERWGKNLSGGQKQRFGIARAYLQASDFVIFDEATAALDAKTEETIMEQLDEALQGRTCLMVSHRLRTVLECDRVIVLKDGIVCAEGKPEELKEHCPEFRELFAL